MPTMHICYASLSYPLDDEPTSGVGSQVRLLAQALNETGNEISVIDLGQHAAVSDDHGVTVHRVRASGVHWLLSKLPFVGRTLALAVRELEYSYAVWKAVRSIDKTRRIDLIEGTETGMLLLALWSRQTPIVIRLHGEQYTFQKFTPGTRVTVGLRLARALQRGALRRARLLISPSYAHAREIQNELRNSHPPIVIVPNNLSLTGATPNGTDRSSRTVLYAGRIDKCKGVTTFLRAAARTRQVFPTARFVIAGDFHSSLPETEFQDVVRSCHLEDNVQVLGPVGRQALADLYKHSTVAVLPSHYETFGLAALEPMVFGTPVIASDSSALPEVVVPEVNGKLVPAGDEAALASAMIELLRDPKTRARMGAAAIEHAAKFDVRNVVMPTERLYRWTVESWTDADLHVFFSPHADDIVLSCGGAIQALTNAGRKVQVVTVFSADPPMNSTGFARHLHRKWRTPEAAARQRRQEDREALRILGVNHANYWDYCEASNRYSTAGTSLYTTYEELNGDVAAEDQKLVEEICQRILTACPSVTSSVFYFPLSLGFHVDHQILFAVGRRLSNAGRRVRFYEDYPYAQKYYRKSIELNWLPQIVVVPIARKLRAISSYQSQLYGLGGSLQKARKRLRQFSHRFGTTPAERYWELSMTSLNHNESATDSCVPLTPRDEPPKLIDFGKFLKTFRWSDLNRILPVGAGSCVDIGCGNGRHKGAIEQCGYKTTGVDRAGAAEIRSDAAALPLQSETQAAAVAWQVMEYVEHPESVFAEVARVLEPGGVFCGSVSFLEPVHGRTYFNLSPIVVETLLRENGFGDIQIKPGLNGFALMLWTWLSRCGMPSLRGFAIPITFLLLVPFAAVLFGMSWLSWRLGIGNGYLMRWISHTAPLEFAGHVMFCARKLARPK